MQLREVSFIFSFFLSLTLFKMKLSHQYARLTLRILHCLGAIFGSFALLYELFIQHKISYSICYAFYLLVTGAILYLLFARKRPNRRFAYGTFCAMSFVTLLFFLIDVYESVTVVSEMINELVGHIEQNKEINPSIIVMVKISKLVFIYLRLYLLNYKLYRCCSINDEKHTSENFRSFQLKYPDTCGNIQFSDAKSCVPFIRNQRNFMIFLDCIRIICGLVLLILLWKYVKDEYKDLSNEPMNFSGISGECST